MPPDFWRWRMDWFTVDRVRAQTGAAADQRTNDG